MEVYKLAHSGKDLDDAIAGRFTTEVLNVTENGSYTPGEGVDGFSQVNVDVQPPLEELIVSENGTYATPEGVYGFSEVTVDVKPTYECSTWYRQPDCPDITTLPFTDPEHKEVYYTIDKQLPGASDIVKISGHGYGDSARVELGYVEGGQFVVVKSYPNNGVYKPTNEVDLRLVDTRFPVIHWVSDDTLDGVSSNDFAHVFIDNSAPVIEVYYSGRYQREYWSNYGSPIATVKAITCGMPGTTFCVSGLAPRGYSLGLELLDFSKHDSIEVISRTLYHFVSGCASLKYVQFPAVAKNSVLLDSATQSNWPFGAFQNCNSLLEVDLSIFDSSECNQIQNMFDYCYCLKTIDISGWDMSLITNTSNTFRGCYSLENLITDGCTMPAISFKLNDSPLLTVDSLVGVIAALPVLADGTSATLTLGATNTAKLTADQLAVATEKGWTVA